MPLRLFKMEIKHSEINNGKIRLHTVKTDRFKMSRFLINFITKSDKYLSPLYKLMLSVMMRGSEKYPTITDINKALDERYGTSVSYRSTRMGDKNIFKLSCKLLGQKFVFDNDNTKILDDILDIISDILTHPRRDEQGLLLSSYVESEKRIAIDAINSKINDPKAYASELCSRYMFEGSKYELYGAEKELISSFSARELTEHMSKFFNDSRIECYYIGSESHERIERLVRQKFEFGCGADSDIIYTESAFENDKREPKYIEEEKDVSQGRLVLGYRCNTVLADKDYYAMVLFNEIFGGGSVSKLFMNVREKKSLCYYCYSSLHSATGTIKVGCGIDPSKKEEALDEISAQLDAMKRGDFTDSEMETARHTVISGIRQINDSSASIEAYMLRRMLGGIDKTPEESCELVMAVTKDDIIAAAEKVVLDTVYFMKGNRCLEDEENE